MRVRYGFLAVLVVLVVGLLGVVHLEAAAAQQSDGGQQGDGGAPPHDDGGPPVEEYRSEDTSGDGGGLGSVLLLIVALVIIDRVWRVHGPRRRPKVSTSARHAGQNFDNAIATTNRILSNLTGILSRVNSMEKILALSTVIFTFLFFLLLVVDGFVIQGVPDWVVGPGVVGFFGALVSGWLWRRVVKARHEHEETMRDEAERRKAEEQERLRIEALLRRDAARDEINYMTGPEFEKFMADFLRRQGYAVEETPLSGDQGVDLILPDFDGKRVVVQLKRYTRPVGNVAVQATFAGMAHYRAEEGWIITTSAFTKSARELAKSTRVRLIDGKELAEWLEDSRDQE